MPKISLFQNFYDQHSEKRIEIKDLYEKIKSDPEFKLAVENVRSSKNEKKSLPCVTISGIFSERNDNGLVTHSKRVLLDFDKVDDVRIKKAELSQYDFIEAAWISSSGNGVHAVAVINNSEQHREHYWSLLEKFTDADHQCDNPSRLCFISSDPDIFVSELIIPYDGTSVEKPKKRNSTDTTLHNVKIETDLRFMAKPIDMIRYAPVGQRHEKTLKAAILAGGYIASHKISRDEAFKLLMQEAALNSPDDIEDRKKAIIQGIDYGLKAPIDPAIGRELKNIERIETRQLSKIYWNMSEKLDDVMGLYSTGRRKGYDVGYKCLEGKVSFLEGYTTYWYGPPASGKTEMELQLLMNMAMKYGTNTVVFTPESGDVREVFAELVQKYARGNFFEGFKSRVSEREVMDAYEFIKDHFIVIDPDDSELTYMDMIDLTVVIERKYNMKIDFLLIDPWNELELPNAGDGLQFALERALTKIRRASKANGWHTILSTHVRDQEFRKVDNRVYFPMATAREIAQGQGWYRKGMQMISQWRPLDTNKKPLPKSVLGFSDMDGDYDVSETVLSVDKSKPKGIGAVGIIDGIYFDAEKHNYYEWVNGKKCYCWDYLEVINEEPTFGEVNVEPNF